MKTLLITFIISSIAVTIIYKSAVSINEPKYRLERLNARIDFERYTSHRDKVLVKTLTNFAKNNNIISNDVNNERKTLLIYSSKFGDFTDAYDYGRQIEKVDDRLSIKYFVNNDYFLDGVDDLEYDPSQEWINYTFSKYLDWFDNIIYVSRNDKINKANMMFINLKNYYLVLVNNSQCNRVDNLPCPNFINSLLDIYDKNEKKFTTDMPIIHINVE